MINRKNQIFTPKATSELNEMKTRTDRNVFNKEPIRMTVKIEDIINNYKNIQELQRIDTIEPEIEEFIDVKPKSVKQIIHKKLKKPGSAENPNSIISLTTREKLRPKNSLISKKNTLIEGLESSLQKKLDCKFRIDEHKPVKKLPSSIIVIIDNAVRIYSVKKIS
jgi:hypothetical protein